MAHEEDATILIRFVLEKSLSRFPSRRPPRLGKFPENHAHGIQIIVIFIVEEIEQLPSRADLKQGASQGPEVGWYAGHTFEV